MRANPLHQLRPSAAHESRADEAAATPITKPARASRTACRHYVQRLRYACYTRATARAKQTSAAKPARVAATSQ